MSQSAHPQHEQLNAEAGLHRKLTAGQMAMVGVGGSIGTGLLLGTGAAVQFAGPAVIVSYVLAGLIAFAVTMAMGELAALHPSAGSFGTYAEIYLNRWSGFVAMYGYWIAIVISVGAELVAAATYTRVWLPHVPVVVLVVFYAMVLGAINLREVADYGRFEYWFAMVKLVAIIAFIVVGTAMLFGGRISNHYVMDAGFAPNGVTAALLATSFALYSFAGTEMAAISSGEARSREEVARAMKLTMGLLAFAYIGSVTVLVGVMAWNRAGVAESPFVTVFRLAGLPAASALMNFVVLTAALSGSNATLYAASRMLFSLARSGHAPAALGRVSANGAPRLALLASGGGLFVAAAMAYWFPENAFLYILGAALFGGMLAWMFALGAHIAFRHGASAEELEALPLRAPGGEITSMAALVALIAAMVATWWVPQLRVTAISGPIYVGILSLAYVLARRQKVTAV